METKLTALAEVMPGKRTEVMAGKYFIQYFCSAAGSATVLPLINKIGVGPACTMSTSAALSSLIPLFTPFSRTHPSRTRLT